MSAKNVNLALECKRQSESCLYTSTSLFIWLRFLRAVKAAFIVLPLVFGSVAGWRLLNASTAPTWRVIASIAAFLAGLFPAIYAALKLDDHLELCKQLA